jgi:hypothetical protein
MAEMMEETLGGCQRIFALVHLAFREYPDVVAATTKLAEAFVRFTKANDAFLAARGRWFKGATILC